MCTEVRVDRRGKGEEESVGDSKDNCGKVR